MLFTLMFWAFAILGFIMALPFLVRLLGYIIGLCLMFSCIGLVCGLIYLGAS